MHSIPLAPHGRFSGRRSSWLGLLVGAVIFAGTVVILTEIVLVVGRTYAVSKDLSHSWVDQAHIAGSPGWLALQTVIFFGAFVAGLVATWLAPRRSLRAPAGMLVLAGLYVFFAQLPSPRGAYTLTVWLLAPVAGVLLGILVHRLRSRGEA